MKIICIYNPQTGGEKSIKYLPAIKELFKKNKCHFIFYQASTSRD